MADGEYLDAYFIVRFCRIISFELYNWVGFFYCSYTSVVNHTEIFSIDQLAQPEILGLVKFSNLFFSEVPAPGPAVAFLSHFLTIRSHSFALFVGKGSQAQQNPRYFGEFKIFFYIFSV